MSEPTIDTKTTPARPRRRRRWLWGGIGTVVFSIGFIGFLHTSAGMALLAFFGMGCPFSNVPPERIEQARLEAAQSVRGDTPAPVRLALGFELDGTTLEDVDRWVEGFGLECTTSRQDTFVKCNDVPRAALGEPGSPFREVCFQFSPHSGRLVNVTTLDTGLTGQLAMARLDRLVDRLSDRLGDPHKSLGKRDVAWVDAAYLRTTQVSYQFDDYLARATVSNMGSEKGVLLRQHYMSISD